MPEIRLDSSKSFKIFSKNIVHSYLGKFHDLMIYDSEDISQMFLPSRVFSAHGVTKFKLDGIIVRRNGKIVWKHVPNGSFYMLMLRTKLYLKSFFSTVHHNINKWNSRTVKIVNSHLPCYVINIRVFSFLSRDTNIAGSTFVKKMLQLFKETN